MARPLRIERPGMWYHVTGRGLERRSIFLDDRDRTHWLELLAEAVERWRLVVYAYVLMDNHYHVMLETREANLGRAMHWLNTAYTTWFNRRRQRVGPLFQGRYKAIVVDRLGWGLELSRYVHLNPIRTERLGLGKKDRRRQRAGVGGKPEARLVSERITRLREYRWSSYRAYLGVERGPCWLEIGHILDLAGRGRREEQRRKYREYVETAVREGLSESPWEQLKGQLVLGSQELWERLRKGVGGRVREQPQLRAGQARPSFAQIVKAVEGVKGERWKAFRDRHRDWGRDLALYLGRRHGALKLAELGRVAGDLDYAAVSAAVQRLSRRLKTDKALAAKVRQVETHLLKVET